MNQVPQGKVSVAEILAYIDRDRYMPKTEAAGYLGWSVRELERRLAFIPHFRLERHKVMFRKSELDSWMEKHREAPADTDLDRIVDAALEDVLGPRSIGKLEVTGANSSEFKHKR